MRRTVLICVLLGLVAALAVSCSACSPAYVLHAGYQEAKILSARQPIETAVEDPDVPPELRAKLELVRQVRVFAERRLGLNSGDSFRSYAQLDRDTLVMVVSAAPELELRWKTWWWPIVGSLPYKGYFDFEAAYAEAAELEKQGYDTYVRPSAAFSTLGWFPDPILSPALRGDSVSIAETVIHEITHTTFFPKGHAQFNESFANFVGHVGAIEYFCNATADPGPCETARERWHDTRVFGRFFHTLYEPLAALYASDAPDDSKRRRKREIIEAAADRFRTEIVPQLRGGRYGEIDPDRVDNAWLLSRLLYYTRLDDFQLLCEREGGVGSAVDALIAATERTGDPWSALDELTAHLTESAARQRPDAPGEDAPAASGA
ncbi:MAG: aminopeptidase [Gemmatimonadales bacterium]|jgi:predicted aminopeptidase